MLSDVLIVAKLSYIILRDFFICQISWSIGMLYRMDLYYHILPWIENPRKGHMVSQSPAYDERLLPLIKPASRIPVKEAKSGRKHTAAYGKAHHAAMIVP